MPKLMFLVQSSLVTPQSLPFFTDTKAMFSDLLVWEDYE